MVTPALTKGDRSPVTVADLAVQAVVAAGLEAAFPDDVLVGEEDAALLRQPEQDEVLQRITGFVGEACPGATAEQVCGWIDRGGNQPAARYWTLDPIDGTKGFLRKEQYVVALALVEQGRVRLGVLGCPKLSPMCEPVGESAGSLVYAVEGGGTWSVGLEGGEPCRLEASKSDDPGAARLLRSVESGHTNVEQIDRLVEALGTRADPVLMDSQAKFAVLAAGGAELLFRLISPSRPDYREKIWDQAAGSLVIEEAGGRVTDLDGKPLDFTRGRTLAGNRGVVASNGVLHDTALAALQKVGA
jgi:3'(2'), 5'-bisphosphate nucleotidase